MNRFLRHILSVTATVLTLTGCTYSHSLDPYYGTVNPSGAKVDTTGVTDYEGISISNAFLPVNFDGKERRVLEADTVSGHFSMHADEETLKKLGVGSVVAFDTDSLMYLRKVKSVHIENGVAEMETEKANPFELIKEGRFGFVIDGKSSAMTRSSEGFDDGREYPVFRPVEMRYQDEDGIWHRRSYGSPATRGEEDEQWNEDDDVEGSGKDHNGSIALDHTEKKFSFPFSYSSFDGSPFEAEVAIDYSHGSKETSDINMLFDISLFGTSQIQIYKEYNTWDTTKLGITVKAGSSTSPPDKVNKKFDKLKEVLHVDHPFRLATIVFMIGPLPIVIDIEFNPEITVSLAANGSITAEWQSIEIKEGMKSGIDFRSDTGVDRISDPGKTVKDETSLTKYIAGGQASLKVAFSPQLKFMIWGFVGPYIGVEAYNESSISVGFGWNIEDAGRYYVLPDDFTDYMAGGYQFKNEVGLNLIAGLDLDFLRKLLPSSWNPEKINLGFQYPLIEPVTLFEAPGSLRCNNNIYEINIGKQNELEFQVMSKLFGKNIPFNLPYFVRVESTGNELLYSEKNKYKGEEDDDLGFSMNTNELSGFSSMGMSKYNVIWTPASLESKLVAFIMGPDGNEISSVIIKPSNTAEDCTPIDMGTSCLWAPMNVGAKVATDRGDYVGWGDPTGKHKEQGAYSSDDGTTMEDDLKLSIIYGGYNYIQNIAGTGYDYATAKWGGYWRLPTKYEWQELISECNWEWNSENKAFLITSKKTGNQLILPANGYRLGTEYADVGHHCNYWSAERYVGLGKEAYYFSGRPNRPENRRLNAKYHTPVYFGQGVRPVMSRRDFNEYDFTE